jgi:hypothetical protein
MNRHMLVMLACIPVACSSDSIAPKASDVGGQWIYRVVQLSDGDKDGSLVGDRMGGTLTVDHLFAGKLGRLFLTGTWTARRKRTIPPPPQPN